jgi:hypothetical protein
LQLGLLKIIVSGDRPLSFGSQPHFGANHVDAGDDAALTE